jgi:hypothetical protein
VSAAMSWNVSMHGFGTDILEIVKGFTTIFQPIDVVNTPLKNDRCAEWLD